MKELTNEGMNKRCPRCGAAFICTHDAFCQCVGVRLNEKAREFLRAQYSDCLCRKCLEEVNNLVN